MEKRKKIKKIVVPDPVLAYEIADEPLSVKHVEIVVFQKVNGEETYENPESGERIGSDKGLCVSILEKKSRT